MSLLIIGVGFQGDILSCFCIINNDIKQGIR